MTTTEGTTMTTTKRATCNGYTSDNGYTYDGCGPRAIFERGGYDLENDCPVWRCANCGSERRVGPRREAKHGSPSQRRAIDRIREALEYGEAGYTIDKINEWAGGHVHISLDNDDTWRDLVTILVGPRGAIEVTSYALLGDKSETTGRAAWHALHLIVTTPDQRMRRWS